MCEAVIFSQIVVFIIFFKVKLNKRFRQHKHDSVSLCVSVFCNSFKFASHTCVVMHNLIKEYKSPYTEGVLKCLCEMPS